MKVTRLFRPALRALALALAGLSALAASAQTLPQTLPAPVITPGSGRFWDSLVVAIQAPAPEASIFYTLDGTDPALTSPRYIAPLVLFSRTTLKAIAVKDGVRSAVATVGYDRSYEVAAPVSSPGPRNGFYPAGTSLAVALSCATPGAAIHYTLDWSIPKPGENGLLYTAPIAITASSVLKMVAVRPPFTKSQLVVVSFDILQPLSLSAPAGSPRPQGPRFHPRWAWEREGRRLDGARR